MAGTRTNALVAAGAAAFVMCGLLLDNDPSARGRIVSYIVSGVGFLAQGSSSSMVRACVGSIRLPRFGVPPPSAHSLGLGSFHLALVLAFAVLFTNMVLRPLAYRLHPVLPEAIPAETLYELKLDCKVSAGAHIHALLLSTIARLPVMLHSIQGDQERHERANPHPRRDNDRRPEQRSY